MLLLYFIVFLVVLRNSVEKYFLVQLSSGERVSVTSLFLKERVSNFCFLASGSSSLSFLSWPRSATGESVSVTVLLRSSRVSNSWAPLVPFSPFFSGFSFASCPRSSFRESVSVTVLFLSSSLSYFSLHPKSAVLLRVSSTSRFLRERVSFSAISQTSLGILERLVKRCESSCCCCCCCCCC